MSDMSSAIYRGTIRHRRLAGKLHDFCYPLFMMYTDLDGIEELCSQSRWFSHNRFNMASFHNKDYLPMHADAGSLRQRVSKALAEAGLPDVDGKVFLLSHWRYLGYVINPISVYYCHDSAGQLQALILEVTNTPWKERQLYVLPCQKGLRVQTARFAKQMHVSPFLGMDMHYQLRCTRPDADLQFHLENLQGQQKLFDATLAMQRLPATASNLLAQCLRFPLQCVQVYAGIHWQALKLFLKGVKVETHPARQLQRNNKKPQPTTGT